MDEASKLRNASSNPRPVLRLFDGIVLIVGIVVGAGIFRTPSIVAANSGGSAELFLGMWLLGGLVSFIGALCYAELSSAFPHTGGDYHFLMRAFGKRFAFLFAWARISVIQTGSIALLAYIVGDYLAQLYPIGAYASAAYAALVVAALTIVNVIGIRFGTGTQKVLLALQFVGIVALIAVGFLVEPTAAPTAAAAQGDTARPFAMGMAMVLVLLTFGGWNEAGYISAELRGGSKKMVGVLLFSILIITAIYVVLNLAYLHVLGVDGMAASDAVAVDVMRATLGEPGVVFIGVLVALTALTSVNATIFTGARTNYALGRDFKVFAALGRWHAKTDTPINALLVQGLVALALIGLGAVTRDGFQSMVDFTAPVFWFFFLAIGIALFVLRRKAPDAPRPFRVPLYPVTPIVFCATCAYLLYSSLAYTGTGALVGVGVLLAGTLFFFVLDRDDSRNG